MAWRTTTTTRDAVLDYVRDHPGATPSDVAAAFHLDHSTAVYHLHRLSRRRHVQTRRDGRHLRHFAVGCGLCPFMKEVLPLLSDRRYHRLLGQVHRGAAVAELHADPRVRGRLRGRLRRLAEAGLVENRQGVWTVTPETTPCRAAAAAGGACDQWGRCAVSRGWHDRAHRTPGREPSIAA